MGSNAFNRVGMALRFVEDNLTEPFILDNVAEHAGLNKYHLHRVFRSITGMPLMEYVRARKLSSAAHTLASTEMRVLDIAMEYGFGSESAFSRAFREFFGITVQQFKREKRAVPFREPACLNGGASAGDGMVLKPRMIVRPGITLVGVEHHIGMEDDLAHQRANKVGLEFYNSGRGSIRGAVRGNVYLAYVRSGSPTSLYMPSVEVRGGIEGVEVPEGMVYRRVPPGKYAAFEYIGFHPPEELSIRELKDIYEHIYGTWVPGAGLPGPVVFHLERVDQDMCRQDYCTAEIHIPVSV